MEQTSPHTTLTQSHRPAEALSVRRVFTRPGVHPFDAVEWELRTAAVGSFRQENVERIVQSVLSSFLKATYMRAACS